MSPQNKLVEGSLGICQQASIHIGNFDQAKQSSYSIEVGKGVYVFLIDGQIEVNGEQLDKKDAICIWHTDTITIKILATSEILLIDVPMV